MASGARVGSRVECGVMGWDGMGSIIKNNHKDTRSLNSHVAIFTLL